MNRPLRSSELVGILSLAIALLLCGTFQSAADVTLPSLISDNMVVQQRARITIWGKADPGESVTVQLGNETAQTLAAKDGNWSVKLPGLKSGGPYDMTVSGKNSITVHNVAIGEVWLCAGESNMEYKVIAARNGPEETADADLPMIRFFMVRHTAAPTPQDNCEGTWVVCNPDTVGNFSAVGYFFARELNRTMRTPIGMLQSAWGPSPAESWTPHATLEKDPALRGALDRFDQAATAYPAAESAYEAKLADWTAASARAKAAGSPPPPRPFPPLKPGSQREPSALYNGMINPLLRYPIRGALWYQGESNTSDPGLYAKLLPAMIGSWRSAWGLGDFPFLDVQLSGFLERQPQPGESRWAELRAAQAAALDAVPKTAMAVTVDIGEEHNMHPPDKQDVAHRLALLAKNIAYGQSNGTSSGPEFSGISIRNGKAVLSFTHANGGLTAKNGVPLKGFAIAGADHQWTWADAQIDGDQVIVQSKQVSAPVAVRYAWADFPDADLLNKSGLPAAPFRTDNWTAGEQVPTAPESSSSPVPAKHKKHHKTPTQ